MHIHMFIDNAIVKINNIIVHGTNTSADTANIPCML